VGVDVGAHVTDGKKAVETVEHIMALLGLSVPGKGAHEQDANDGGNDSLDGGLMVDDTRHVGRTVVV